MSKNVDGLHDELLANISDTYQKSEGFPTWDILRAFAFGLKNLWDKAFKVEEELDVDNLTGTDLERFISQRKGLARKSAVQATGELTIVTGEGVINEGDLFATALGVQFEATETVSVSDGSKVSVKAINGGSSGNVPANSIVEMPVTLVGISTVTNELAFDSGYDAESDNDFRERYYDALREPATSGNIYHYKRWAKEVEGVGDAKVFSLWNGDNTVQIVIIDSEKTVPDSATVNRCQAYIDVDSNGNGEGQAPIGAYCTVTPATALLVNVTADITCTGDIDSISEKIKASIIEYLAEIAFKSNYVSVAKIGDIILNTDNVTDYDTLTVNGSSNRLAIPAKSVAVIGEVVINAISQ